jgi:ring-1,2-phenylacetyl-CoA epoxidase subunit PaaC
MARMLWFSAHQTALYASLGTASDETLRGVAEKASKEVRYHLDHARQWVLRLGDGTEESHQRMQAGLVWAAPYVDELFDDEPVALAAVERGLVPAAPSSLRASVQAAVEQVVADATLTMPEQSRWRSRGGREGIHSRPMGYLLAEMQHIARSNPGATW